MLESSSNIVAVTGGSGFVGRRLVDRLSAEGYLVRVLTRDASIHSSYPLNVTLFEGDLTDDDIDLSEFLDGVTTLFHCAGEIKNEKRMHWLNVDGTRRLAEYAKGRIKRWVQLSSIGVYGQFLSGIVTEENSIAPTNRYEKTKALSDEIVLDSAAEGGYEYSIVRPANIIGGNMPGMAIQKIIAAVDNGYFFYIGSGKPKTNYIHVDNVVEALLLSSQSDTAANKVYNLSDTQPLEQIVETIAISLNKKPPKIRFPEKMVRWGVEKMEHLNRFPLKSNGVDALVTEVKYPIGRIEQELNYSHIVQSEDAYTGTLRDYLKPQQIVTERDLSVENSQENSSRDEASRLPVLLWGAYFCYAAFVALVFQKFLLPMIPSMHGGNGLLVNDAQLFHREAVNLAEQIKLLGWDQWRPWISTAYTGNVSVLAGLYALFGPDPAWVIPINAALHATGGLLIFLISRTVWSGDIGKYAGLMGSLTFVLFPSSLNWYAQVHKDGYVIVGLLLVLYSWVVLIQRPKIRLLPFIVIGLVGGGLIGFVRPYVVQLLVAVLAFLLVLLVLNALRNRQYWKKIPVAMLGIVIVATLALTLRGAEGLDQIVVHHEKVAHHKNTALLCEGTDEQGNPACSVNPALWKWERSDWIPTWLENYLRGASILRTSFLWSARDSGSLIDGGIAPNNAIDMLLYLPRALQISVLSPFPEFWFAEFKVTRLIGVSETIIWYCLLPGVFIVLLCFRSFPVLVVLAFGTSFLIIYGYVTPNIGTLHRVRYPFMQLLMLCGLAGWMFALNTVIEKINRIWRSQYSIDKIPDTDATTLRIGGRRIITSSLLVSIGTAVGFLFLFIRDVMIGRIFGVGESLDAFYLGMMIPMLLVNVVSIPFGSALIPAIATTGQKCASKLQVFVNQNLILLTTGLVVIAISMALFLEASSGFRLLLEMPESTYDLFRSIFPYGLLLLVMSGGIVIGNSVLNAQGIYSKPIFAQSVVPVITITSLLLFHERFGVLSIVMGLLIGQVMNYLLVYIFCRKVNITIVPRPGKLKITEPVREMFLFLAVSAAFIQLVTTIDVSMASTLGEGMVSIYTLGSKVVLFVTGVIATVVTVVLLPYFSGFTSGDSSGRGQSALSMCLYIGVLISLVLGVFLLSINKDLVTIIFRGGALGMGSMSDVSRVSLFGMLQLPFFVGNIILIRYLNANKKGRVILLTNGVGLVLNVFFNLIFVHYLGVEGLALSTAVSLMISTGLMMAIVYRYRLISLADILVQSILWVVFIVYAIVIVYLKLDVVLWPLLVVIVITTMIRHSLLKINSTHVHMACDSE